MWASETMPGPQYFGALSYGAFLMSFGIILLKFSQADADRPDWVYRICAIVMCLMSCGIAYTAQFVHTKTDSRGLVYDLLVGLHMVVSSSVASAMLAETWPFSQLLGSKNRVAIVLPVVIVFVLLAVARGMLLRNNALVAPNFVGA